LPCILFLLMNFYGVSQTIMFDDFTYSSPDDAALSFNKWEIISGPSGPPEGGQYNKSNVAFVTDPANSNNKLITLSTTVNGSTKATTHARIETSGFEYFEGTYAARVYLSDNPFTYKDANIQTFYTIVSSSLAGDGSQYSELDIVEYMAADKWGTSTDNRVAYYTSWHKYQADPWAAWKTYFAVQGSIAGWHTFIAQCTDGVNVKYWIDDTYLGAQSKTDANNPDGNTNLSVYPRSNMQVAFANWIWNNVVGTSTTSRTTTMQADWVLYYKNTALTKTQIDALISGYRTQGLQRRNLAGQTVITNPCTVPAQPGTIAGNTSVTAGSTNTYSVTAVAGVTYTWTLPSGWSGSSTTNSITTTAGATGGTISVKANNSCGSSTARTLAVSVGCTVPAQPGAISGNTTVTSGSSNTYSVTAVAGVTYAWTLPSGWSGSSTTNSITATAGSAGGTISVTANNSCGASVARTLAVTIGTPSANLALNKPATTSTIEGTGFEGSKAVDGNASTRWASIEAVDPQWIRVDLNATYNINRVKIVWEAAYASAYEVQVSADGTNWTPIKSVTNNTVLTNDWTGLNGSGRYIRVNGTSRGTPWGYSIFELEVYGTSGCTLPVQPSTITGNTSVTAGSSNTYSVTAVSGVTYSWTLPSGWSGNSTSNSITTTAGSAGGTISVVANNACGASPARTLAVSVGCTLPAQPSVISGNTTVTSGSTNTYSVTAVSGVTYTWTLPSGWSGTSTSNSITSTAGSAGGTISVKANNACGSGTARTLAVTVGSSTTNLALNKAVVVSSVEPQTSFNGSLAVDGNSTTRWSSNYVDPSWIYVDLAGSYNINRVKITWEAAYATAYQVQISTDASNWTTIKPVTGNAALVNDWTGLSGTGRYVRIYGTTRVGQWGYSIFELEVYGTSAGGRITADDFSTEEDNIVFPNPVENILFVKTPAEFKNSEVNIYDISGRNFSFRKIDEHSYDVSALPSGFYVLRLVKDRNFLTRKFIKK
jgi:hypothetical protein